MSDRFEDPKHIKWSRAIKTRDDFQCRLCGKTNTWLESHHINSYDWCVEGRFSLENGITLCKFHHDYFHRLFQKGRNTQYQFEQYKQIIDTFKKILQDRSVEQPK